MWIVQIKGDPDSRSWEISVVRESNTLGRASWGWFNEDKLLISHNGGPCGWPLAAGLGQRMVAIAREYADDLNRREARAALADCVFLFDAWRDGIFLRSGIKWEVEPPAIANARRILGSYAPDRDGDVRAESRVAERQSGALPIEVQAKDTE